ncbi:WH2 domain-containing protein [Candidatus Cardinium hertigii]|uniref:WH2 domain-containing protein n=1 Tax=Candidatus Cardinium hertigii TaxID=247481 RepID=A0A2Z3LFU5_9BACT|nr:WH2 domain-containing protein [Candidatus Cardinium hertigii]AWN81445.1 hypothetical protein DK880_00108 [Candidatus Cardinium hertigii]
MVNKLGSPYPLSRSASSPSSAGKENAAPASAPVSSPKYTKENSGNQQYNVTSSSELPGGDKVGGDTLFNGKGTTEEVIENINMPNNDESKNDFPPLPLPPPEWIAEPKQVEARQNERTHSPSSATESPECKLNIGNQLQSSEFSSKTGVEMASVQETSKSGQYDQSQLPNGGCSRDQAQGGNVSSKMGAENAPFSKADVAGRGNKPFKNNVPLPPPPPPPVFASVSTSVRGNSSQEVPAADQPDTRQALFAQIREGGVTLRKVEVPKDPKEEEKTKQVKNLASSNSYNDESKNDFSPLPLPPPEWIERKSPECKLNIGNQLQSSEFSSKTGAEMASVQETSKSGQYDQSQLPNGGCSRDQAQGGNVSSKMGAENALFSKANVAGRGNKPFKNNVPLPPPPPPVFASVSTSVRGNSSQEVPAADQPDTRQALFAQIREGGVTLRKVEVPKDPKEEEKTKQVKNLASSNSYNDESKNDFSPLPLPPPEWIERKSPECKLNIGNQLQSSEFSSKTGAEMASVQETSKSGQYDQSQLPNGGCSRDQAQGGNVSSKMGAENALFSKANVAGRGNKPFKNNVPLPPPPPPVFASVSTSVRGNSSQEVPAADQPDTRQALFAQIREGGVTLRKVEVPKDPKEEEKTKQVSSPAEALRKRLEEIKKCTQDTSSEEDNDNDDGTNNEWDD